MIRSIVKLGLLLVVGILVYNFFFGDETEKEQSRRIFQEVKEVGVAVGDLLKSEKEKFDAGKYDDALTKIEDAFDNLKSKAEDLNDSELLEKVRQLERERERIQRDLDQAQKDDEFTEKGAEREPQLSPREQRKIERDIEDLLKKTNQTVEEEMRKQDNAPY